MTDTTFDVRIYEIETRVGARKTSYRAVWRVSGQKKYRGFATKALADSFRSKLRAAASEGTAFYSDTGEPVTWQRKAESAPTLTWFQVAQDFTKVKWPHASPKHRKALAQGLTAATLILLDDPDGLPVDQAYARAVLRNIAFVPREQPQTQQESQILNWLNQHSLPITELERKAILRLLVDQIALKLDGTPAAVSYTRRTRSAINSCINYAIDRELISKNHFTSMRSPDQNNLKAVDPRTVPNPVQGRALLAAVHAIDPTVTAYFASMYYAAFRPGEARALTRDSLTLPVTGWGEAVISTNIPTQGKRWTDNGTTHESRPLKHRCRNDARVVPIHPELVTWLRLHLDTYETGPKGQLFVKRVGRANVPVSPPFDTPLPDSRIYSVWKAARSAVFQDEGALPPAKTPYDLRHAAVSTWLAANVPPQQVAAWAGHSVAVLLRVYAKCLDQGQYDALKRIESTMA